MGAITGSGKRGGREGGGRVAYLELPGIPTEIRDTGSGTAVPPVDRGPIFPFLGRGLPDEAPRILRERKSDVQSEEGKSVGPLDTTRGLW